MQAMSAQQASEALGGAPNAERTSNLKDFKVLVSKCRIKSELDADTAIEISRALTEAYVNYKLANLPEKADNGIRDSYNHALKSLKSMKPAHLKTQIPAPPPPVVHKTSSISKSSKRKGNAKSSSESPAVKKTSKELANVDTPTPVQSSNTGGFSIPFTPTFGVPPVAIPGTPIPPGPPMMPQPPPGMFPTSMPQMPVPPVMPPQMPFQPGVPPPFMPGIPVSSSAFPVSQNGV
ncbi:formin-2-like [Symsagittifera roscoffensis]|uniref:formin-2-like n=1 Tax=Symsagittifera roscoffensis TaxID=84072 RepID=UPI00307C4BB4